MTLPMATQGPPRVRHWPLLAAAALLLAAGAGAWWSLRPAGPDPPRPGDIQDDEVRAFVAAARQKVLDDRGNSDAWGQYGKVLLAQLFDREADACFVRANEINPEDARWYYARGLIALKRAPEKAVALLRQAAEAADAPLDYREAITFQLAEALLDRGQVAEAENLFRAEAERDPGSPRAAVGLGLIAVQRGDDDMAMRFFDSARPSPYAKKFATAQLAALARAAGQKALANSYEAELADLPLDPPWPDPLLDENARMQVGPRGFERRVKRLEKDERFAEAADLYLKRIAKYPSAEHHVGAGLNLARLRDYDRAIPLLREAVRIDPQNAQAQYTLAMVVFARAERAWHEAPETPQINDWFREAADHARRAAELRPALAQAFLFWGLSLKYLGEPAAAVAPLRQGLAAAPGNLELHLGLGQALLESDQLAEAETYLNNAHRIAPNDPRPVAALEKLKAKKS